MSKHYYSPLRFPGGKRKLVPFIKKVIEVNDLEGGHYVEPYAGGAAVALELVIEGICSMAHINDISKPIHAFWYSVINHNVALCKKIEETEISMQVRKDQQRIIDSPDSHSLLELGFAAFFLNRTSYSGILNGGVIGGKDQKGQFKIDARFPIETLIERIRLIGDFSDQISLHNEDAINFLSDHCLDLPENTLIYLDPPYFIKGKKLYENYYQESDHQEIEDFLADHSELKWLVSYDNAPEILEMYADAGCQSYQLQYFANQKYKGEEVMFFGPEVEVPEASVG